MNACTGELRRRVKAGELLVFAQVVDNRSGMAIEVFQEAGYDVISIDREHTALDDETIQQHIRLCRALNIPVMVRVNTDSYEELNRTLDQAPDSVIVPRVRSRAQVDQYIRTIMYPPVGIRGLAGYGCPVAKYHGWPTRREHVETVNDSLMVAIQIETKEALDNVDAIVSHPRLDMVIIGNDDLSLSLGIPGDTQSQMYQDAVMTIIAACQQQGVAPGIPCADAASARFWIERGMRAIWYGNDVGLLWAAASQKIRDFRAEMAGSTLKQLLPS